MQEVIVNIFALIGVIAVGSAILIGLTLAVVRAVRWKRRVDAHLKEWTSAYTFTPIEVVKERISNLPKEINNLWQAIDDINKRMKGDGK